MNNRTKSGLFCALCLLAGLLINAAGVRAQEIPIEPQPLYDQCQNLTQGSSAGDEVAQAIASLKDQDPRIRTGSAEKLSRSCDRRAVEPLVELLRDGERPVRLAAIEALGKLGD